MDALDAALIRGQMRNGVFDFTGVDPRRTVASLASEVGISRNAARERLDAWRTSGFQAGMSVFVNPGLYQLHLVGRYLSIKDPTAIGEIREKLASNDRLFLSYEFGSQLGRGLMLSTLHAFRDRGEEKAQEEALRSLNEVEPASPPLPARFPSPRTALEPIDRRIVSELRARPELGMRALAERLGITVKRAQRHLSALLDGDAVFFLPHFDFTRGRSSVLLIGVFFPADVDFAVMLKRIHRQHPDLVRVFPSVDTELLLPPAPDGARMTFIGCILPVKTGQLAGAIETELRGLRDVRDVTVSFPITSYENRRCFDRLLDRNEGHGIEASESG